MLLKIHRFKPGNSIFTYNLYKRLSTARYPLLYLLSDIENRPKGESFSSLYISGRYGGKLYPTAIPHIDLKYFISNFDEIYETWRRRDPKIKLTTTFKTKINQLSEVSLSLEKLTAETKLKPHTKEKFGVESQENENKMKQLLEEKWNLEEEVIPILLNAPNEIHPRVNEDKILYEFGPKPDLAQPKSCVALGFSNSYLEIITGSPNSYYLIGKLAKLELDIIRHFVLKLKNEGLEMVSLPNFSKSAIVEACGKSPFNPNDMLRVKEKKFKWGNSLHIPGSASLEAYASYFTRTHLNSSQLPLKLFNIGRHYNMENIESNSILKPFQSSEIFAFTIDTNENQSLETFDKLCLDIQNVYETLRVPFRIKQCSVVGLKNVEMLKIEFDLWSPFLNSYINCGYLALYGNYLSQRLMITDENGFQNHCGGCVVNVTVLLACMMENYQNTDGEIIFPQELIKLLK